MFSVRNKCKFYSNLKKKGHKINGIFVSYKWTGKIARKGIFAAERRETNVSAKVICI